MGDVAQERVARGANSTKGANSKEGEAHPRREGLRVRAGDAVLVAPRGADGSVLGSKAHAVGVGGVHRGGPARVDGLDLDDPDSPGAVKAKQHQVRDVSASSPRALHPLRESSRRGAPEVGEHVLTAEGSREEGGKDLDDRAVAGGLQPHPVHALHEVKRAQGGEGGVRDIFDLSHSQSQTE